MEIIGLAFATVFLFVVAAVVGCVFAFLAWLLVRNRECRRVVPILIAAAIPVLSAAYFWLCVAMLPGESLFGDISQPLPNGYSLEALGKMPDFATINKGNSLSYSEVGLSEDIDSLTVSGPIVAGRYSHPLNSFTPKHDEGYFVFDTRTGQFIDFKSLSDIELRLGHRVKLVPTWAFTSNEPSYKRQQAINRAVMFAPPVTVTICYLLWLLQFKRVRFNSNQH